MDKKTSELFQEITSIFDDCCENDCACFNGKEHAELAIKFTNIDYGFKYFKMQIIHEIVSQLGINFLFNGNIKGIPLNKTYICWRTKPEWDERTTNEYEKYSMYCRFSCGYTNFDINEGI